MSKKVVIALVAIYLVMFGLNFLVPLYYGDDFVYAFIWPNQFMNIPLPETVERVDSIKDIFVSQWRHYFTGNGRTIAHLFIQFFVWQGKWLFNLVNPFVFVLLILQIHWFSDGGNVSFQNLCAGKICWIFFILWIFVADFYSVYLWLAGACNYLWSIVILLFFLMPYVHKFFNVNNSIIQTYKMKCLFFFLGICAGWGNENTICWIIVILAFGLYKLFCMKRLDGWLVYGFVGLCIGFIFLILSPGNAVRTKYYLDNFFMNDWVNIFAIVHVKERMISFGITEYLQVLLWYYIFTSLRKLDYQDKAIKKCCILAKYCCLLSLLFNIIMLLTPEFPLRSGFASLVFVTIAAMLTMRARSIGRKKYENFGYKKLITFFACTIFLVTLFGTYLGYFQIHEYDLYLKKMIQDYKQFHTADILEIYEYDNKEKLNKLHVLSGGHLLQATLSDNENHWQNVAVARYYGIKGIRMVKKDKKIVR